MVEGVVAEPQGNNFFMWLPPEVLGQVLARVYLPGQGMPHLVHPTWAACLRAPQATAAWLYHGVSCKDLGRALVKAAGCPRPDAAAIVEHLLSTCTPRELTHDGRDAIMLNREQLGEEFGPDEWGDGVDSGHNSDVASDDGSSEDGEGAHLTAATALHLERYMEAEASTYRRCNLHLPILALRQREQLQLSLAKALQRAARCGHAGTCRALMEHPAAQLALGGPAVRAATARQAFMDAVTHGHVEVLQVVMQMAGCPPSRLVQAGINVCAVSPRVGKRARACAAAQAAREAQQQAAYLAEVARSGHGGEGQPTSGGGSDSDASEDAGSEDAQAASSGSSYGEEAGDSESEGEQQPHSAAGGQDDSDYSDGDDDDDYTEEGRQRKAQGKPADSVTAEEKRIAQGRARVCILLLQVFRRMQPATARAAAAPGIVQHSRVKPGMRVLSRTARKCLVAAARGGSLELWQQALECGPSWTCHGACNDTVSYVVRASLFGHHHMLPAILQQLPLSAAADNTLPDLLRGELKRHVSSALLQGIAQSMHVLVARLSSAGDARRGVQLVAALVQALPKSADKALTGSTFDTPSVKPAAWDELQLDRWMCKLMEVLPPQLDDDSCWPNCMEAAVRYGLPGMLRHTLDSFATSRDPRLGSLQKVVDGHMAMGMDEAAMICKEGCDLGGCLDVLSGWMQARGLSLAAYHRWAHDMLELAAREHDLFRAEVAVERCPAPIQGVDAMFAAACSEPQPSWRPVRPGEMAQVLLLLLGEGGASMQAYERALLGAVVQAKKAGLITALLAKGGEWEPWPAASKPTVMGAALLALLEAATEQPKGAHAPAVFKETAAKLVAAGAQLKDASVIQELRAAGHSELAAIVQPAVTASQASQGPPCAQPTTGAPSSSATAGQPSSTQASPGHRPVAAHQPAGVPAVSRGSGKGSAVGAAARNSLNGGSQGAGAAQAGLGLLQRGDVVSKGVAARQRTAGLLKRARERERQVAALAPSTRQATDLGLQLGAARAEAHRAAQLAGDRGREVQELRAKVQQAQASQAAAEARADLAFTERDAAIRAMGQAREERGVMASAMAAAQAALQQEQVAHAATRAALQEKTARYESNAAALLAVAGGSSGSSNLSSAASLEHMLSFEQLHGMSRVVSMDRKGSMEVMEVEEGAGVGGMGEAEGMDV